MEGDEGPCRPNSQTNWEIVRCELFIFLNMSQPRPFFRLFLVFSNKHYNFYNNKCENFPSSAGIRTYDFLDVSLLPY